MGTSGAYTRNMVRTSLSSDTGDFGTAYAVDSLDLACDLATQPFWADFAFFFFDDEHLHVKIPLLPHTSSG